MDIEAIGDMDNIRQSFKCSIYYAAKDGHNLSLIARLNDIKDSKILNYIINESYEEDDEQTHTLLTIAAKHGRYNVVKTLLTKYSPDIEAESIIKCEDQIIEGATALWCAVISGHLNIIKLLVYHGADVNHPTKTRSTPVRAACFDGRLDIVKFLAAHGGNIHLANSYNNTCLMLASYKGYDEIVEFLLNEGALPNEQALCGATALHYAAEYGHVDICRILLDNGAALMENLYGMKPVITAAERVREAVVELFCFELDILTKSEKIDALELLGATYANDKDLYDVNKACHYLMLAMRSRYEDPNNIIKKKSYPPVPAYENWIESQTLEDLQAIRFNVNSIHMESLTIRERILGAKCPEVAHPIIFRGAVCADNGRFDRCESLWLHALALRQGNRLSVQRDLLRFAQVFSQMFHTGKLLRFKNVLTVLSSCILELERNRHRILNPGPKDDIMVLMDEYEKNVITCLYLITIMTKLLKKPDQNINKNDLNTLYKSIYTLNQMNVHLRDGQTLLHLAVNGITPVDEFHTNDVCRFPCVDTVKLLLHCGAKVSTTDCDRNSPLHTLTSTLQTTRTMDINEFLSCVEGITELLMKAGIHIDCVNNDGLTASQICTSGVIEASIRRYESQFINLKCLASRCIARHKIKYDIDLPQILHSYVKMHCSEKVEWTIS